MVIKIYNTIFRFKYMKTNIKTTNIKLKQNKTHKKPAFK